MRAWLASFALVAACTPQIEGGSYYCGPDESCPPDERCDGATNLCVVPSDVTAFACADVPTLPVITSCTPAKTETHGCVWTADGHTQVTLAMPADCGPRVEAQLIFPIAFMPLQTTVRGAGGAAVATSSACSAPHGGVTASCVAFDGMPGQTYTLDIASAPGGPTCDGACAFNRFALTVSILRP